MEGASSARCCPCNKKKASSVPPTADLICMCMAQRTIAELWACQLQRSAQSAYCSACRCLRSHAAPSAASCRWGSGRAGLGGAGGSQFSVPEGAVGLGLAGLGRLWRRRGVLSIIWCPASCCRDWPTIYSHALDETLVNRPQRREISWVQQQPPARRLNNEICVTHRLFFNHFIDFFL